ncbi:DNA polymerase III subunit alpha [bacterium]|nr:DNA polymerase III subunit alpha [bacterium]
MFCHLHLHSQYSLLESSVKIGSLISKAKELGMKNLALTDTAVMHGVMEFYKEAVNNNIKPIIGSEIFVLKEGIICGVLLLAKNIKGYENLCRIISSANLNSKNCPAPVDFNILKELKEGIIAISEFNNNELHGFLEKNDLEEAVLRLNKWTDVFGEDFYIEIQRIPVNNLSLSSKTPAKRFFRGKILTEFAARNDIKIVAGNDVHYLLKQDYETYIHLARLKLMSSKENLPFFSIIQSNENYLKSHVEMQDLFSDLKNAIENTEEISGKCNVEFELNKSRLPRCDIPENETQESLLKKLCYEKVRLRYGEKPDNKIYERLEYELSVIEKTGFCGYFLIVSDIARFASENKIPTCGKGSSAGSLVTYLLGISNVDPLQQNLYFERFLNEERKNLPDIDIDTSSKGRYKIINYLSSKYGKYNILRVPVFTTFKARASIREAGRILSLGKEELDEMINSLPHRSIKYSINKKDDIKNKDQEDNIDNGIINVSQKLSGYVRHIAMHPCAFIILGSNAPGSIPLMKSETGEIMSQYGLEDIESMGFLKIDLINSLTLDHIDEVMAIVEKTRKTDKVDLSNINYDDKKVCEILSRGDTLCTFQLESMGIRSLMRKLKPETLADIILLISLYRPGPQQSGMVDIFIERKFGREKIDYLHDDLKEILEETCGVMLYQEQVMKVAVKIAGYSLREADRLRKAMATFSYDNMETEKDRFINGAVKKGYDIGLAAELFRLISKFASYGFVKAHAAAYAEIGYKTCFLKVYYPAELLSVILTKNSGYYCKNSYIEEARRLGITIKLPDINLSGMEFLTEDFGKSIRISLISVKDLGISSAANIIKEREKRGLFKNFTDFYERIIKPGKITIKAAENLIKIGAFDFSDLKRKYLLLVLEYLSQIKQRNPKKACGNRNYKKNQAAMQADTLCCNSKEDGFLKTTGNTNVPLRLISENPDYPDSFFPQSVKLIQDYSFEEKLEIENHILEFCASANPLQYFENELKNFRVIKSRDFGSAVNEKNPYKKGITTSGIILIKRKEKTKNDKELLFLTLEDWSGMYEVVIFSEECLRIPDKFVPGNCVLVNGNLSFKNGNISVIADKIISLSALKKTKIQNNKDHIKSGLAAKAALLWKN